TTCDPFVPEDTVCGVFAPGKSNFYQGQGAALVESYMSSLFLICPNMGASPALRDQFPLLFCLGAMGKCYGATYTLPDVDANGVPTNPNQIGAFYNTAKFGELAQNFKDNKVPLPCYEDCHAAMQSVIDCPAMNALGVTGNVNETACTGFPKRADDPTCVQKFGTGNGAKTAAPTPSPTSSTPSQPAKSSAFTNNASILIFFFITT
ncbi:hypothetical protein HK099_003003, partial [Clydaea vesicula]